MSLLGRKERFRIEELEAKNDELQQKLDLSLEKLTKAEIEVANLNKLRNVNKARKDSLKLEVRQSSTGRGRGKKKCFRGHIKDAINNKTLLMSAGSGSSTKSEAKAILERVTGKRYTE